MPKFELARLFAWRVPRSHKRAGLTSTSRSAVNSTPESPLAGATMRGSRCRSRCLDGFPVWSQPTPAERATLFLKADEIVKRRRKEIAEVLARETGSTISFVTYATI